ncbi:hypothetical protein EJ070_01690 [Mesorhizobium sp. M1E.F.Ca.ET.045.02.1.1]|nr:hypothetical protein EJ070_01690 [Mesorhizobium sp. M1E.F.Ca.ET.045.02.1.1]
MGNRTRTIAGKDITRSVADALQTSHTTPPIIRLFSRIPSGAVGENAIGQLLAWRPGGADVRRLWWLRKGA